MFKTIQSLSGIVLLSITGLMSDEITLQQGDSYQGCTDCYVYSSEYLTDGGRNSDTLALINAY